MVIVKFFGWAKDLAGTTEASLPVNAPMDIESVWTTLAARYAGLAAHRASCALAVNRCYATPDTVVRDGDEIAVIPPVSGG